MRFVAMGLGVSILLVVAAVAVSTSGRISPRRIVSTKRPAVIESSIQPIPDCNLQPQQPTQASTTPIAVPVVAPPAPSGPPAAPSEALQDGGRLQSWLFGLSEADFKALAGTKDLNEHITAVVRWLSDREAKGEEIHFELAQFLAQVNARMAAARR